MKLVKILLLILSVTFISCATKRPEGATEAEVLFKEAQSLIKNNRYIQATEKLNTIRSQFPYSFYATHAELLQADVLFSQQSYPESAAAYILFRDFHPKHAEMGYVIFRISESFYRQLPETFDRDLSAGNEAIKYYEELIANYSHTEYAKDAQVRINEIKGMLVKKEVYIADFYFKTKDFSAALARYESILGSITDKNEFARVQKRISEAQKKIQKQ